MKWQPIETAPRGELKSYGTGPWILGIAMGDGWTAYQIVSYHYHKNPSRGAWKGPFGVWEPTYWMPLPEPPEGV